MKRYKVVLQPDAVSDLITIYDYIAQESGSADIALNYIERLEAQCRKLEYAPLRGQFRNDIRENLRTIPLAKRAVAAFEVDAQSHIVTILNIFYGGQDFAVLWDSTRTED